MYLGIDVGGTKTLVAVFNPAGKVLQRTKFPTPRDYSVFLDDLVATVQSLNHHSFEACAVAIPGRINRQKGLIISCGNLGWADLPVRRDIEQKLGVSVVIENDANLAGLSEALLVKDEFKKVLYITISTGIGTGVIINGMIDPELADSEGGQIVLEHEGVMQKWEHFASGKAIVKRYGKRAADITDQATWRQIVPLFAEGILDNIATIQPEVIIIGGGVGSHFDRFGDLLIAELNRFGTPIVPIPPVIGAKRAEEAVIYGCYELLKAQHGPTTS